MRLRVDAELSMRAPLKLRCASSCRALPLTGRLFVDYFARCSIKSNANQTSKRQDLRQRGQRSCESNRKIQSTASRLYVVAVLRVKLAKQLKMVMRKMKEKCKDAARMRREKERAEFVELSKLLPLPSSTTSQLDKASIIRLTSSYLRMRSAFPEGLGANWGSSSGGMLVSWARQSHPSSLHPISGQLQAAQCHRQQMNQVKELGSLILQTLDGFVVALHSDGKIMYISETASVHLGLPQIDLTGSSIFEYVHSADHNDIYDVLNLTEADKAAIDAHVASSHETADQHELGRSFCMRMKCILPKRNAGLVSSGYKTIHCTGYLKVRRKRSLNSQEDGAVQSGFATNSSKPDKDSDKLSDHIDGCVSSQEGRDNWESYALVAVGHSLLPTASTEVKLNRGSFMFRANLDLKLYYIEPHVTKLLGFEQVEIIGQSLYQFIHLNDTTKLELSHKTLLCKGQVVTRYYRLMKKDGGSIWIQSYATIVNNPRSMPKPQHIVGICFILGEDNFDKSCAIQSQSFGTNSRELTCRFDSDNRLANELRSLEAEHANVLIAKYNNPAKVTEEPARKLHNGSSMKPYIRKEKSHSNSKKSRKTKSSGTISHGPHQIEGKAKAMDAQSKQQSAVQQHLHPQDQPIPQHIPFHYACMPSAIPTPVQSEPSVVPSIGSLRRTSDDSCSIVSSAASTSVSSNSHQSSDYLSYTSTDGYDLEQHIPLITNASYLAESPTHAMIHHEPAKLFAYEDYAMANHPMCAAPHDGFNQQQQQPCFWVDSNKDHRADTRPPATQRVDTISSHHSFQTQTAPTDFIRADWVTFQENNSTPNANRDQQLSFQYQASYYRDKHRNHEQQPTTATAPIATYRESPDLPAGGNGRFQYHYHQITPINANSYTLSSI